jgi:hypothetical protein
MTFSKEAGERTALCLEKWQPYLTDTVYQGPNAKQFATLLESQAQYLDNHMPDDARSFFRSAFGGQWRETFLHSYVKVLNASKILTQFATQPMHGPIGCATYLSAALTVEENAVDALTRVVKEDDSHIPEISLRVKTKEIAAKGHPMSAMFPPVEELADIRNFLGGGDGLMDTVLEEVVTARQRAIIGVLREAGKKTVISVDPEGGNMEERAKNTVRHACNEVYRRTMRGPANHVVGGNAAIVAQKSVGRERKAHVHHDPCYPNDELLAWYTGLSMIDGCVVWSPLCVVVTLDEKEVPVEQENGEIEARKRTFLRIGFRDAITLVDPDAVVMVKLPGVTAKSDMPNTVEIED